MKKTFLVFGLVFISAVFLILILPACKQQAAVNPQSIVKTEFGKLPDGRLAYLYTLTNKNGLVMKVTNYGGTVTSLSVPDKNGSLADIVLGFDTLQGYLEATAYFGAIVGRYGNRIAKGQFKIDGINYILAKNNGPNTLHGGIVGFDKVLWETSEINDTTGAGLKLHYISKDGDEGFPGNLNVTVTYMLTNTDDLKIVYEATTDKATPLNLTHHSYFNLAGAGNGDVLGHSVMINAQRYTVVDTTLIPTGELKDVKATPFDFTTPRTIGSRINELGVIPVGYDNNYVLNNSSLNPALAARVSEPVSGRVMEVYTDQPGVQFYTGNFLDGSVTGKNGKAYKQHYGFCLETQKFPDSPNQPAFPNSVLQPGTKYRSTTIYKFLHQ
jgi:aldose 1-epimerase